MSSSIANPGWLNTNAARKLPLHEGATLKDTTGTMTIPNDLLVDGHLPVHASADADPSLFHVIGIAVLSSAVVIDFGYDGAMFGRITVDRATFVRNTAYRFRGTGAFYDTTGTFVIGSLENILKTPGAFVFDVAGGRLETSIVRPDIRGVDALWLKNGAELLGPLQGDLVLEAARNFSASYTTGAGTQADPNRITLNAIEGAGLGTDCGCGPGNGTCIQTIDGVQPDDDGNIDLLAGSCIALDELAGAIRVRDTCAEPCCGCAQLDIIKATLEEKLAQVNLMVASLYRLEAAINTMQTNLLT